MIIHSMSNNNNITVTLEGTSVKNFSIKDGTNGSPFSNSYRYSIMNNICIIYFRLDLIYRIFGLIFVMFNDMNRQSSSVISGVIFASFPIFFYSSGDDLIPFPILLHIVSAVAAGIFVLDSISLPDFPCSYIFYISFI